VRGIRGRLARHGLAPSRERGQNFLRSEETARRIVTAAGVTPEDAVVEIGPGLGRLTLPIAAVARRVIALEVDRGLVRVLGEMGLPPNVEVRHEDALRADLGGLARELGPPCLLLGNLPYSIAGRLLGGLLGPRTPFRRLGFMLQREVAQRALAAPGSPDWGPLGVFARLWARGERVLELSPDEFEPRPRVRSAFVIFDPQPGPPDVDAASVRAIVRAAFRHRRKTLRGSLRRALPDADRTLERAGIDPRRRAETLSETEFVSLARAAAGAESP
jgi:16S rRNA (adenine1518-N6/adenine1519-N6)-dimethyltransferase